MTRTSRGLAAASALVTVAALLAPVPGVAAPAPAPARSTGPTGAPPHRPARPVTRLIVRMADGSVATPTVRSATASLARVRGASVVRRLSRGATLLDLGSPLSTDEAWRVARALTARPDVASAEPDTRLYPTATSTVPNAPDDPLLPRQWDLWDTASATGGFSTHAAAAWSRTLGSPSVVVAVLDTGLTVHPDLTTSVPDPAAGDPVVPGYDFVSDSRIANDGGGRDGDPSDPGDWVTTAESRNGFFQGCVPDSSSWHGTHVTGTIVARRDNGLGISGIAPGARVQPIRALGKCGGDLADIIDAVVWAAGGTVPGVPDNPTPATVINMSLGGQGACSPTMQDAITFARGRGTTVVVAAGNSGVSIAPSAPDSVTTGSQPADCQGVISVAATDRGGHLAGYSNFGTTAFPITVSAPGGDAVSDANDIWSTVNTGSTVPAGPGYASYAGTSMATPHVAAAVALMQSQLTAPLSPAQVAARLRATALPLPSGSGCTTPRCGPGLVDADAALADVPGAPGPVLVGCAVGAVDLAWTGAAAHGNAISGYRIQADDGTGSWRDVVATTGSAGTTYAVTEVAGSQLVPGSTYTFRVSAINGVGEGPATTSAPVVFSATCVPGAMTAPSVTGGVERLAPISWALPVSTGSSPLTGYSVRYRRVGAAAWTCVVGILPDCLTTSLTRTAQVAPWPTPMAAGTYEVQVAAVNAVGAGPYSPSRTAVVAALRQRAVASGTVLRPYADGFQDSIRFTVSSNLRTSGSVRIVNSSGSLVRTMALPTGTSWVPGWTGRDAAGRRVPYGTYRADVRLVGRTGVATRIALLTFSVRSSQASRPTVSLSSTTFYPAKDGYRDTVTIRASDAVPSTWVWRVIRNGRVVWSRSFSRRLSAAAVWDGTSSTHYLLPVGTYTLKVTARGGEGWSVSTWRTLTIAKR